MSQQAGNDGESLGQGQDAHEDVSSHDDLVAGISYFKKQVSNTHFGNPEVDDDDL